jgi:hypothetical protein
MTTANTAKLTYNRCVSFTLPSGTVVTLKMLGDKAQANADAKALIAALTSDGHNAAMESEDDN